MHEHRPTRAGLLFFVALLAACARSPVETGSRTSDAAALAVSPSQTAQPARTEPAVQSEPPARIEPPAAASAPASAASASSSLSALAFSSFDEVVGSTWQWVGLSTAVEELEVYATDRYTIRFLPTRRVELTADCNQGGGNWSVSGDHDMAIGPITLTRMACPTGSLSERFATSVDRVSGWLGQGDDLYLELPGNSGVLRFRRHR